MRKLKSYKIWTEAIDFDDREWDQVEPEYDSNLEREFEEILDYFLEVSDQHPDIRFL